MKVCELEIRRIQWQETIALRNAVLWPNENAAFCYVDGDEAALHFGGVLKDELVCVASIYCDENSARLRKFATKTVFQGRGIGTQMLERILVDLKKNNVEEFWCDARESAVEFYQRFNMDCEGDRFYKSDIPYFKMRLSLS